MLEHTEVKMKKFLIALLVVSLTFFCACNNTATTGGTQMYNSSDDSTAVSTPDTSSSFANDTNSTALATSRVEPLPNIDYSAYKNLIDAKIEEYGNSTTTLEYESERSQIYEAHGLIYTHLVDLDNDGIYELILANADKGELLQNTWSGYSGKPIEIYALDDDGQAVFIGATGPIIDSVHSYGGFTYVVGYTFVDGAAYIGEGIQNNSIQKTYYRYTKNGLIAEKHFEFEPIMGTNSVITSIDGEFVSEGEFKQEIERFNSSETNHYFSGLYKEDIDALKSINSSTMQIINSSVS